MYDRFALCYVMIRCRAVIGSVRSVFFFIWPTETKIFGLQSSQLKQTKIVETQSVLVSVGFLAGVRFLRLEFGPVGPLVFFPKILCLGF